LSAGNASVIGSDLMQQNLKAAINDLSIVESNPLPGSQSMMGSQLNDID